MSEPPKDENIPIDEHEKVYFRLIEENEAIKQENNLLKERINQLTAFLYQITNQYEEDFFNDSMAFMQRQSIIRAIKARLVMSPEIWDIVNKSKQSQTEPSG